MSFKKGAILRIYLKDFMTYEEVELKPGPKLNILIGPNGSGKSSIISAIVLGLGGKPKIIGRAKHVGDYVAYQKEKAIIEIELCNPSGLNYSIKRIIGTNGSSIWFLHGKSTNLKKIEDLTKSLNIQVDNLCQLLPQDRVRDVAKMNSKELLENTQKLIGDNDLYMVFHKLKEYRTKLVEITTNITKLTKNYEEENRKKVGLEIEVKLYKERQERKRKIELMHQKLAWLRYEEIAEKKNQVGTKCQKIQEEFKSKEKQLLPIRNSLNETVLKKDQMSKRLERLRNESYHISEKLMTYARNYHKLLTQARNIESDYKAQLEINSKRESAIEELNKSIQDIESTLAEQPEDGLIRNLRELEGRIQSWMDQFKESKVKSSSLMDRSAQINKVIRAFEFKIRQNEAIKEKRYGLLEVKKDVSLAYKWIQVNKNQFQGKIYGPIFLEINVTNPSDAKYLEQIIAMRDLNAFLCDKAQDMKKLASCLKSQNIRVNIVNSNCRDSARGRVRDYFPPKIPIESVRKFGFRDYLSNLFECPDPVLWFLLQNYNLHNIPVGDRNTIKFADQIPKEYRLYFTENECVSTRSSRYSAETARMVNLARPARFLAYSVDPNLANRINEQLKVKRAELENLNLEIENHSAAVKNIDVNINKYRGEKKEVTAQLERIKSYHVRLRMKQRELKHMEQKQDVDPKVEAEYAQKKLINWKNVIRDETGAYINNLKSFRSLSCEIFKLSLKLDKVMYPLISKKRRELDKEMKIIEEIKVELETVKAEYETVRKEASIFLSKAKQLSGGLVPDNPEFKEKLVPLFKTFPNNIEDLNDAITELELIPKHLRDPGEENVIHIYNETLKTIERLENELVKSKSTVATLEQEAKVLKDNWLPRMDSLVQHISSKFSKFFESMGCAGVIDLDTGTNEEEYEKYGLNVKVKFRNESSLQSLNAFTQSGGERSLTIAVFLLSLQGITSVPFRCVDEINQGLDEGNERRVYELLFGTISKLDSAQYFLLTPKLIDNLEYTEDSVIHCVYSGYNVLPYDSWSVRDAIEFSPEQEMEVDSD